MSIPKKYNKNEDDKLLFCGCTKYNRDDKNGILLIYLEINNNKNILNMKKKFFIIQKIFKFIVFVLYFQLKI